VQIREATPDDAVEIAALHADSWRRFYRGAYADEYLDGPVVEDRIRVWQGRLGNPAPNQHVIVAEDGGAIIGLACAYGADDATWGTYLDNLHVRATRQGNGMGAMLLREIARWSLEAHQEIGFYLGVLEQNSKAQKFYKRLGAKDVGGFTDSPPGGGEVRGRRYAWRRDQLRSYQRRHNTPQIGRFSIRNR
jgi:ribosomal protein S18 acetylase RimI-like enzyme